ncbi:DEAD-box family RNA helicase [Theileria orientalis strain Shintoku]|uniref:ATP-dependent RNA helicase n=1 Tax=Theileria orientalis strain Shintoku TaxID=869250 RepID=J4C8P7_THEOR|nr:DEAD-box family RNA helicase [Theileria orientalis strain Shintoku]BAM41158.1 DEAD-box family RNA helicase [Theileria orientalis strain Shintoku]|eukprot:XP_009691459.1 DEAD-box family RNA helicase [Theileria orientalis strain Shintoku]
MATCKSGDDHRSSSDTWSSEGSEFELASEDILNFGRSNLNSALLENVLLRFKRFTPVQRKAIPVILSGRDALIKSQTGSGKTLAALIPLLNLLLENSRPPSPADLKLLIVVPSNDLIRQVHSSLKTLLKKCSNTLTFGAVAESKDALANVVVTKPSVAVEIVKSQELEYLVVDEADLLFEFGYKKDMLKLIELLRSTSKFKKFQAVLLSATLDYEIKNIANLLLYKPVYVDVPFTQKLGTVNEYYILVEEKNKLVTLYVLLKMESIPYGSIIFVNSNKKGYHLYCFLRKLSLDINIVSKLLSPKLRHTILQNFNQGLIGCLIVIDDETDQDMNLSRGVDFVNLKCVINFDEPKSLEIYKHRIGRTGRNYQEGSSLTFFTKRDDDLLLKLTKGFEENSAHSLQLNEQVEGQEHGDDEGGLKRLTLDESVFESFKYRVNDILKTITPKLVETAQMQSVRHSAIEQEEFLKNVNENDVLLLKSVLKNDNQLLKPEKKHLTYIPKYLVDENLQNVVEDIKYQIHPSDNAAEESRLRKLRNKRARSEAAKRGRHTKRQRKRKFFKKKLPHFKKRKK